MLIAMLMAHADHSPDACPDRVMPAPRATVVLDSGFPALTV
jgi:hypothetical protein